MTSEETHIEAVKMESECRSMFRAGKTSQDVSQYLEGCGINEKLSAEIADDIAATVGK